MTTPGATRVSSGSTSTTTDTRGYQPVRTGSRDPQTAETKPAFKTTEFFVYLAAVVAVLIATQVVDGFLAKQGWLYVTILTVGYMLSRGIAKSGSYAKDSDPRTDAYPNER